MFDGVGAYFANLAELKQLADAVAVRLRPFQRSGREPRGGREHRLGSTPTRSTTIVGIRELAAARMVLDDASRENLGVDAQFELARQVDAAAAAVESDVAAVDTHHFAMRHERDACAEGRKCRSCRMLFAGAWMTDVIETRSRRRRERQKDGWLNALTGFGPAAGTRDAIVAAIRAQTSVRAVAIDAHDNDPSIALGLVRVTCVIDDRLARDTAIVWEIDILELDVRAVLNDTLAAGVLLDRLTFIDERGIPVRVYQRTIEQYGQGGGVAAPYPGTLPPPDHINCRCVATPGVEVVTCAACGCSVSPVQIAPRTLYPIGVCVDCVGAANGP